MGEIFKLKKAEEDAKKPVAVETGPKEILVEALKEKVFLRESTILELKVQLNLVQAAFVKTFKEEKDKESRSLALKKEEEKKKFIEEEYR